MLPNLIAVARGEIEAASFVGGRDETIEKSIIVRRAGRAAVNIQESMIVFLPLAGLAIASGTSLRNRHHLAGPAGRYLITYLMGISFIRTFIWFDRYIASAQWP